jgi:hypothetical protein
MMQGNSYLQHLEVRGHTHTLGREARQRRLLRDVRRAAQPAHKPLWRDVGGILMALAFPGRLQAEATPDMLPREDLARAHGPADMSQEPQRSFATQR